MPKDVVCGSEVGEDTKWRVEYRGKTYFFCCEHCMRRFLADPEMYLAGGSIGQEA